jgi:hypothetical protein
MERFRTHISALYILSVALLGIAHCWPVAHAAAAPAQTIHQHHHEPEAAVAHDHAGQASGCVGDEAACALDEASPALHPASASMPDQPVSKDFVFPSVVMLAVNLPSGANSSHGPPELRTRSAHGSYSEAYARTGRLLI